MLRLVTFALVIYSAVFLVYLFRSMLIYSDRVLFTKLISLIDCHIFLYLNDREFPRFLENYVSKNENIQWHLSKRFIYEINTELKFCAFVKNHLPVKSSTLSQTKA